MDSARARLSIGLDLGDGRDLGPYVINDYLLARKWNYSARGSIGYMIKPWSRIDAGVTWKHIAVESKDATPPIDTERVDAYLDLTFRWDIIK